MIIFVIDIVFFFQWLCNNSFKKNSSRNNCNDYLPDLYIIVHFSSHKSNTIIYKRNKIKLFML